MYNYIPHPSNCRVSSAVLRMLMREGVAGYGVYWMILEMLRDAPDFRMFYFPESFAYACHCPDVDLVTRVCRDYGLFVIDDDDYISSGWLASAMGEYSEKKLKLQEAGRRGAAKRWAAAHTEDGQAIATPSVEDGQAIAYNATKPDITSPDIILPDLSGSPRVSKELVEALSITQQEGHAPGYVAQVCLQYGMSEGALNFLCEHSNNADLNHPTYKRFCALVRRIQAEKFTPKHPDGFFLKKLFC